MLHVVVAVIHDKQQRVLIAQRAAKQHQGGKWEFSGGKVEVNESAPQALARELDEELGIQIECATPLIQLHHYYPDVAVFLDVYEVKVWQGIPYGKEGQAVRWVNGADLEHYAFPVANKPILTALKLPQTCLVTPEIVEDAVFKKGIKIVLNQGVKLIQFRAKTLDDAAYHQRAQWLIMQCARYNCLLVFNSPPSQSLYRDGLHLTSSQLLACTVTPTVKLLSAACHNQAELQKAQQLGVDFVFLSPINKTSSHPDQTGKGWQWFADAIKTINMPVYALGGVGQGDIKTAIQYGGQGIAAISQLWKN
jgi:8-oxo-dGTP diphosphatase